MLTVASARPPVHAQLAEPLADQPLDGRVVLLVLLLLAAFILFQSLRALIVSAAILLRSAFALGRLLLVVVVLIVAVGLSLAGDVPRPSDEGSPSGPAATSVRARPTPSRPPARTRVPTPSPQGIPSLRSFLPVGR